MKLFLLTVYQAIRIHQLLFAIAIFFGGNVFAQKAKTPLFTRIQPDESGIEFANLVPENDSMNIIAHPNHWNGGGVAIGDFNNDNLPDIYFTGNNVSDRLYLNKGDLRFDDMTGSSGVDTKGGWKTGVALVDINKDGWLDVYVCRAGPNSFYPNRSANLLYLNNGDLTFTESAELYGIGDAGLSIQAVFFDMDNDGDEDLFVANNNHELSYGSNIYSKKILAEGVNRLYRNNGDGSFDDVSDSAGILKENALSLNAVAADLNNDGLKDIYVSNDLVSSDHVYINLGEGKFQERGREMFKHYSSNAMGSDIADFNNDGLADVLVVDMFPENAERQKNQAGITNDYFESMVRQGHHPQYVRNTLSLNNGNGTFSDVAHMAGVAHTDWSWCPLFADFDNDGLKDILVTNSLKKNILDNDFRVYKMDSILRFVSGNKKTVLYKELNKTESLNLKNYVFRNEGGFFFSQKMTEWGIDEPINTTSAAYGDLDNDGDLDLVFNNMDTIAWLYRNNSSEIGNNSFLRFNAPSNAMVRLYTSEGIQTQEPVGSRGYQSYPESVLHFGLKDGTEPDSALVFEHGRLVNTILQIRAGSEVVIDPRDFPDSESIITLPEPLSKPQFVEVQNVLVHQHQENQYDDFKREPLLYEKHSQSGPFSCKGDVNNDGLEDIYVSGAKDIKGVLWLQNTDGRFEADTPEWLIADAVYEDGGCTFFDVNADGYLDLYVGSSGYELDENSGLFIDRLYVNDGAGNFTRDTTALPEFRGNTICVKATDYNSDGYTDIFIGSGPIPGKYPQSYPSRILKNQKGKLVDVSKTAAPGIESLGIVTDAIWTDQNQDGKTDLIVVGHWMPITVFLSKGKKFRQKSFASLKSRSGFWNVIEEVDLNEDGVPDYVVGNRGLNTRLQSSEKEPITIYSGDFDGNGALDQILTYYVQGEESVIHTRDAVLDQMIGLKKKYLFYKQFAKADVHDILGSETLELSTRFQVNELRSCALLGSVEGGLFYKPLEITAQTFPVRSITKVKENGLILAGNSQDAHFSFGKDQAGQGCFLKSDGTRFHCLESGSTGLNLDGIVTSLQTINISGQETVVGFKQDAKSVVFRWNKARE